MLLYSKELQEAIKKSRKLNGKESKYSILSNENESIFVKNSKINNYIYQFSCSLNSENRINVGLDENTIKLIEKIKNESKIDISEDSISTQKRNISTAAVDLIQLNNFNFDERIEIETSEFKQLMQILKSAAQDETRPILQGVCFRENDVVALDGYRMSLRKGNFKLNGEYIINANILKSALSLITKDTKQITIEFSNKYFKICIDNYCITGSVYEGDYIKYQSLIPKEFKTKLELNKNELKDEIDFILSGSPKDTRIIFELNSDKVILKNYFDINHKTSETTISVELEGDLKGEEMIICFNPKYIKEAIGGLNDNIYFNLNSKVSPVTIKSDGINGLELVLPVRMTK